MDPLVIQGQGADPVNASLYYGADCRATLKTLPEQSVHCMVTSPPYWGLRDYSEDGQIGLESTPTQYIEELVDVFREIRRVLRDDGTAWLNLGDSFVGANRGRTKNLQNSDEPIMALPEKNLLGIPWRVAFALQEDGWVLRSDIVWAKPNPQPESIMDRPTRAHEYVFLLAKNSSYYYDADAIREPHASWNGVTSPNWRGGKGDDRQGDPLSGGGGFLADGTKEAHATGTRTGSNLANKYRGGPPGNPNGRNKRSVWFVRPANYKESHFATYPVDLIRPCILAGCPPRGTVLDPFSGSATTGVAAFQNNRHYIGLDLNRDYLDMACRRLGDLMSPGTLAKPTEDLFASWGIDE